MNPLSSLLKTVIDELYWRHAAWPFSGSGPDNPHLVAYYTQHSGLVLLASGQFNDDRFTGAAGEDGYDNFRLSERDS